MDSCEKPCTIEHDRGKGQSHSTIAIDLVRMLSQCGRLRSAAAAASHSVLSDAFCPCKQHCYVYLFYLHIFYDLIAKKGPYLARENPCEDEISLY